MESNTIKAVQGALCPRRGSNLMDRNEILRHNLCGLKGILTGIFHINPGCRKYISQLFYIPWWRHQMETFSALLAICAGNSSVPGEFPTQRPVTQSFDVFFDLHLNKRLSNQSRGCWFETPSCLYDVTVMLSNLQTNLFRRDIPNKCANIPTYRGEVVNSRLQTPP